MANREVYRTLKPGGRFLFNVWDRIEGNEFADVVAYCQGTPLKNEIEAWDPSRIPEATTVAAEALARRFGSGPIEGRIAARVFTAVR